MRPWKKWWWENPPKSPWQCLCLTAYKEVVFQGIDIKLVTVWKILKRSFKWDQSGISSFIRSKVMSKTSKIKRMEEKFNDLKNRPKSPQHCSCLTAYNSVVFQWISKKLVTVGKILKRSFKWDQSGISNFKRLKVISKTRDIVQKRESFMACTNHPEKNEN